MIEIPSFAALLAVEAIAGMSLVLAFLVFRTVRKRKRENEETTHLVDRLSRGDGQRPASLKESLSAANGHLPEQVRTEFADTIGQRERDLYRSVIEAFLTRDTAKLEQIDRQVHALSEPYCRLVENLLQRLAENDASSLQAQLAAQVRQLQDMAAENGQLRQQLQDLAAENEHAKRQHQELNAANERLRDEMKDLVAALDEVSAEYTRSFHERRDNAELQSSRLKMLHRFRLAAGVATDADEAPQEREP